MHLVDIYLLAINRYAKNVYEIKTLLAVQESNNPLGVNENLTLAFNWGGNDPLEGRIATLESYTQNLKVAKQLNWEISYWSFGRLLETEVYKNAPYIVEFDKSHPQAIGVKYELSLFKDHYEILSTDEQSEKSLYDYQNNIHTALKSPVEIDGQFKYYEWLESSNYRFRIIPKSSVADVKEKQAFYFQAYDHIAKKGTLNLKAYSRQKGGELLELSLKGFHREKICDFLNTTVAELSMNLRKKINCCKHNKFY